MGKRAHGEGSLYQTADGYWHASINLGAGLDGKRVRRHVQARTQGEVRRKLDQLKKDRESGVDLAAELQEPTVGEWADTWLGIVERTRKPSTAKTYGTHLKYLRPIRRLRLTRLTPEHLESVYEALAERGVTATSVQGAHRTFRSCFGEAVRRGKLERNPATAARPGRGDEREIEPLTLVEAQALLEAAIKKRNSARWQLALALGLRQGEVLGLQWDDVDLETGRIRIRRALQAGRWKHGCGDAKDCGVSAARCPKRHGGGLTVVAPKSKRAVRQLVLPGPLIAALKAHKSEQAAERLLAGSIWQLPPLKRGLHTGSGWVFATPTGKPIDPRRDWQAWKDLLTEAGVRNARLHDARHTAATFMLVAGVDTRTVMDLLGWSQPVLAMRYQHVVDELKEEAARRVGRLLWGSASESG